MIVWVVFVICVFAIGWHYVGYPVVLGLVARVAGADTEQAATVDDASLPSVSIIIIAHNEADCIEARIENCLASNYPTEKLDIIVASDASTDETVRLARAVSPQVTAFNNTPHNKSATRNRGVEQASHDIILFTDADTRYEPDCVRHLVGYLVNDSVGAVCGTLVSESFTEGAIGRGMDLYWRWEYWMRRLQSQFGALVKSTGANMGMKRSYFEPVADTVDIDQVAGFMALRGGSKSRFVPEAIATEQFPTSVSGEFQTRRRLTIRGLTALWTNRRFLNPVAEPSLAVHTFSYWLLRYLIPLLLLGTLATTALLSTEVTLLGGFLTAQAGFYLLAVVGYVAQRQSNSNPLVDIPFSYCWANVGVLVGLVAFLRGDRVYAYDVDN